MSDYSLKVLIVEDDLLFSIELEMLVQDIGYEVLARVDNSEEALKIIIDLEPDFILMDIDIKGALTGLEVAKKIMHLDIPVLFITSFGDADHYKTAQDSNSVGYLVKPVDKYSLITAISLAVGNLAGIEPSYKPSELESHNANNSFLLKNFLFFRKKGNYHKILIDDILYFETEGNYVNAQLINGERLIARLNMTELESFISQNSFMRIHRKFMVQLEKIEQINVQTNNIILGGLELPISRRYRDDLLSRINKIG